ncbi:MAG TPA: restriction endonuclease [Noviherbaspirillum sp.]|jgi:restriction system protein|uniref:restriction endonuclease n=1 Tax=Noviherbaspirillum sp. TaxID=1926288 RepID=UPI002DDD93A4|nr:restriction endonuclease [Noviherbaspirillum sp.]HEV2611334.1 restriction endonuclease [Noviherbaspirillum sp.]
MKLKMAEKSLFAILLRSPWWISILIAAVISLAASAMLPRQVAAYGISAGLPFLVVGIVAAWRQLRMPSPSRVAELIETINAMPWRDFANAIEQAYRRDGYDVKRLAGPAADFEIAKAGRTVLVSAKRWKAAGAGIEPLRELQMAAEKAEARESIFIMTGQLSDNAKTFASQKNIRVMQGNGLAELLQGIVHPRNT